MKMLTVWYTFLWVPILCYGVLALENFAVEFANPFSTEKLIFLWMISVNGHRAQLLKLHGRLVGDTGHQRLILVRLATRT